MSIREPERPEQPQDGEVNFLDYINIILKRRWMIIGMCSAAVITAALVSLRLPKIYSATAVSMPSQTEKGALATVAAQMGGFGAVAERMLGTNPTDIYVEILASRTIADTLIQRFNLLKIYNVPLMENARKILGSNTRIKASKSNTIRITVEDEDPRRAADLANAYVEELNRLGQRFNVSDAARQRIFLDKRVEETRKQLIRAETRLKEFQEQNKLIALMEQAQSSIQAAARIKGEIMSLKTELAVLRGFVAGKSNKAIRLEKQLAELRKQLAEIETGIQTDKPEYADDNEDSYIPFIQVPDLGLRLARLTREVKIQETVFGLLIQQYEMIKIAEAKDTSTVVVLDKALLPEERTRPQRTLIVVFSGIIALSGSIFLAFLFESAGRIKSENREQWERIKAEVGINGCPHGQGAGN